MSNAWKLRKLSQLLLLAQFPFAFLGTAFAADLCQNRYVAEQTFATREVSMTQRLNDVKATESLLKALWPQHGYKLIDFCQGNGIFAIVGYVIDSMEFGIKPFFYEDLSTQYLQDSRIIDALTFSLLDRKTLTWNYSSAMTKAPRASSVTFEAFSAYAKFITTPFIDEELSISWSELIALIQAAVDDVDRMLASSRGSEDVVTQRMIARTVLRAIQMVFLIDYYNRSPKIVDSEIEKYRNFLTRFIHVINASITLLESSSYAVSRNLSSFMLLVRPFVSCSLDYLKDCTEEISKSEAVLDERLGKFRAPNDADHNFFYLLKTQVAGYIPRSIRGLSVR